MNDSSVSRDYGAVTIRLSVLAMSPLGTAAFPWLCPSLEGTSLRTPYILPPLPCLANADRHSDAVGPFFIGGALVTPVEG